jgi:hypothetical protein
MMTTFHLVKEVLGRDSKGQDTTGLTTSLPGGDLEDVFCLVKSLYKSISEVLRGPARLSGMSSSLSLPNLKILVGDGKKCVTYISGGVYKAIMQNPWKFHSTDTLISIAQDWICDDTLRLAFLLIIEGRSNLLFTRKQLPGYMLDYADADADVSQSWIFDREWDYRLADSPVFPIQLSPSSIVLQAVIKMLLKDANVTARGRTMSVRKTGWTGWLNLTDVGLLWNPASIDNVKRRRGHRSPTLDRRQSGQKAQRYKRQQKVPKGTSTKSLIRVLKC